jgi:hypothetical protein
MVAPGGAGTAVWARVHESDFLCRGCGLRSPLTLSFSDEVECLRCGLRQAFDSEQWKKALAVVHAAADLCGPDPEGRFPDPRAPIAAKNSHRTIGLEHTFVEHTESGTIIDSAGIHQLTLRVKGSPGHPLCTKCRTPLSVMLDGRGQAQTVCERCGERALYGLAAGAADSLPRLRAVVGEEYRTDRPAAKIGAVNAAGIAAMMCPSCGAGLSINRGDEFAACSFCRTTSRISKRAWGRPSGEAPPFEAFWLLFEGPSLKRAEISGGGHREQDDEEQDESNDSEAAPAQTVAHGVNSIQIAIWIAVAAILLIAGGYVLLQMV